MTQIYLTIDDSPTPYTDYLADALIERSVPALFFVRGDMMDKYSDAALHRLVSKGFVLGNHMDTHTRASTMAIEDVKREILNVQNRINAIYAAHGIDAAPKFFRFPHMDRGTGGWIVDYNKVAEEYRDFVISLFADGLNVTLDPPTDAQIKQKHDIQEFLKQNGFAQPFKGVTFPWFEGEMSAAQDCMYTFSTSDWMLLDRHRGKWPYKSMDDLKKKIDLDTTLSDKSSRHIILAHDKDEQGFNQHVIALVDYFLSKEFEFLPI